MFHIVSASNVPFLFLYMSYCLRAIFKRKILSDLRVSGAPIKAHVKELSSLNGEPCEGPMRGREMQAPLKSVYASRERKLEKKGH